jgi:hypothetical protein
MSTRYSYTVMRGGASNDLGYSSAHLCAAAALREIAYYSLTTKLLLLLPLLKMSIN